jgi:hypothetical protein
MNKEAVCIKKDCRHKYYRQKQCRQNQNPLNECRQSGCRSNECRSNDLRPNNWQSECTKFDFINESTQNIYVDQCRQYNSWKMTEGVMAVFKMTSENMTRQTD